MKLEVEVYGEIQERFPNHPIRSVSNETIRIGAVGSGEGFPTDFCLSDNEILEVGRELESIRYLSDKGTLSTLCKMFMEDGNIRPEAALDRVVGGLIALHFEKDKDKNATIELGVRNAMNSTLGTLYNVREKFPEDGRDMVKHLKFTNPLGATNDGRQIIQGCPYTGMAIKMYQTFWDVLETTDQGTSR